MGLHLLGRSSLERRGWVGLRIPIQVWLRIYLLLGELALDLLDDKVLVGVRLHENEGGLEAHGCRLQTYILWPRGFRARRPSAVLRGGSARGRGGKARAPPSKKRAKGCRRAPSPLSRAPIMMLASPAPYRDASHVAWSISLTSRLLIRGHSARLPARRHLLERRLRRILAWWRMGVPAAFGLTTWRRLARGREGSSQKKFSGKQRDGAAKRRFAMRRCCAGLQQGQWKGRSVASPRGRRQETDVEAASSTSWLRTLSTASLLISCRAR